MIRAGTRRLLSRISSSRHLLSDIAALSVVQALSYLAPLVTIPYLVRVLGPSPFGLLSFVQGIVLFFSFFTDFGFDFSATRAIVACRDSPASVSRVYWTTICCKTVLLAVSGLLLSTLVISVPALRERSGLFAANFLYVVGTAFFPGWLLQGSGRIKSVAGYLGAARLLTLPAVFLFVVHPSDYVIAGAVQASVEVIASILAIPIVVRSLKVRWYRPSMNELAEAFREAWPLFLSGAGIFVSTSSTTVILGLLVGKAQVGYYSAAEKLVKACITASTPLGQALFPRITAVKVESQASAARLLQKSLFAVGGITLLISLVTAVLAPYVCSILLGPSFKPSIIVLQWLSPLPLLYGLLGVLGMQTMVIFGMDRALARIILAGMIGLAPLNVLLMIPFGAVGAAAASVTQMLVIVVVIALTLRLRGVPVWRGKIALAEASPAAM